MRRGGGVHTVPARGPRSGWWNEANGKVVSRHSLKELAVEAGREIARKMRVEHTIHLADGTIGEKNSYGNDPHPPRG
jgi:Uncharacterized protein conserved in bacteria (DUF2188)